MERFTIRKSYFYDIHERMKKNIGISILAFITGLIVSLFADNYLRELIRYLYCLLTNDAIYFVGKNFHLFASKFYFLSIGLLFPLFWLSVENQPPVKKFKNGLSTLGIFFITLIIMCWIDSYLKVIQCTACEDGRRSLSFGAVNYDGIVITSALLSYVPGVIRLIKRKQTHGKK